MTKQELTPAADITPLTMLNMAVEQGADIDKLSKLMDLQERWETNQARKAYVAALTAFKKNPAKITKNKSAGFDHKTGGGRTEYDYATLPQVVSAIAPELSKHKLSHSWGVEQGDKGVSVTCTLTHQKGHSESVTLSAPVDTSGSKNPIQAIGSTVSYLERYSLLAITGLATEDMDDDGLFGGGAEFITEDQVFELEARMQDVKADKPKFFAYLGVEDIAALPADKFKMAFDALEKKRLANAK